MFKNATIFNLPEGMGTYTAADIETLAAQRVFVECGSQQDLSLGWVPPRQEGGALVEPAAGNGIILKAAVETKTVPPLAIERWVKRETERLGLKKLGRKQAREMKENALLALLPQAFPKMTEVAVWVDTENRWLVMDTSSASVADYVATLFVNTVNVPLTPMPTLRAPVAAMTEWMRADSLPGPLSLGAACELSSQDAQKASIKFKNLSAESVQVTRHLDTGFLPVGLSVSVAEVGFYLTEDFVLKAIDYPAGDADGGADDAFDADVAMATGELRRVYAYLFQTMGRGE